MQRVVRDCVMVAGESKCVLCHQAKQQCTISKVALLDWLAKNQTSGGKSQRIRFFSLGLNLLRAATGTMGPPRPKPSALFVGAPPSSVSRTSSQGRSSVQGSALAATEPDLSASDSFSSDIQSIDPGPSVSQVVLPGPSRSRLSCPGSSVSLAHSTAGYSFLDPREHNLDAAARHRLAALRTMHAAAEARAQQERRVADRLLTDIEALLDGREEM